LAFDFNYLELEDLIHKDLYERSDETLQFILTYLVDGEWHDREEVVSATRHVINPGKAYRKAEQRRLSKLRNDTKRLYGWSDEQLDEWMADEENTRRRYTTRASSTQEGIVRTGQRMVVMDALNGTTRIEQKADDAGRIWVRRIPLAEVITGTQSAQERRQFMKEVIGFLASHSKISPIEQ